MTDEVVHIPRDPPALLEHRPLGKTGSGGFELSRQPGLVQARPTDPGLASLIDARPHLPETIRRAVFALVRAAYH